MFEATTATGRPQLTCACERMARLFPVVIVCLGCLSCALKVLCCVFPRGPNPFLELFEVVVTGCCRRYVVCPV